MYKHLISTQRSQIFAYLQCGKSVKFIAQAIGVHESTIYRELSRNRNKRGGYAHNAHEMAMERQERIAGNRTIKPQVKFECLQHIKVDQWSPEQISGEMALKGIKVSHTTIYKWVREDKEKGGSLYLNLRHKGHRRKSNPYRHASARNIPDRVSIKERPSAADGKRFGNWEMDLILGKNGFQAILVLVERSTGYVIIHRLKHGKKARELASAVNRLLLAYRAEGVLTITTDNGSEFSQHKMITKGLRGVVVYFADPYASWQKGLVEYTNKLIRQYIPKGADFDKFNDVKLMDIQKKLNLRPRKKLKYSNPKKEFFRHFS
ncbi:MAG: IS30 family transposase [Muribaculaceae bacterium]|nr:IS30 family transposase [Muribaculaceae bacterium]